MTDRTYSTKHATAIALARRLGMLLASEMDTLDTREAFKPSSPHWGSHPSPVAEVVPQTADKLPRAEG